MRARFRAGGRWAWDRRTGLALGIAVAAALLGFVLPGIHGELGSEHARNSLRLLRRFLELQRLGCATGIYGALVAPIGAMGFALAGRARAGSAYAALGLLGYITILVGHRTNLDPTTMLRGCGAGTYLLLGANALALVAAQIRARQTVSAWPGGAAARASLSVAAVGLLYATLLPDPIYLAWKGVASCTVRVRPPGWRIIAHVAPGWRDPLPCLFEALAKEGGPSDAAAAVALGADHLEWAQAHPGEVWEAVEAASDFDSLWHESTPGGRRVLLAIVPASAPPHIPLVRLGISDPAPDVRQQAWEALGYHAAEPRCPIGPRTVADAVARYTEDAHGAWILETLLWNRPSRDAAAMLRHECTRVRQVAWKVLAEQGDDLPLKGLPPAPPVFDPHGDLASRATQAAAVDRWVQKYGRPGPTFSADGGSWDSHRLR